jgi:hypothetical protein
MLHHHHPPAEIIKAEVNLEQVRVIDIEIGMIGIVVKAEISHRNRKREVDAVAAGVGPAQGRRSREEYRTEVAPGRNQGHFSN